MSWFPVLWACTSDLPADYGIDVHSFFPFDCERTWAFTSTDERVPYRLVAVSDTPPAAVDGTPVYTLRYTSQCLEDGTGCVDGALVRQIAWSSTEARGVSIHGFAAGEGPLVRFEPPVTLARGPVSTDVGVETTTGGAVWTATVEAVEPCPVLLEVDWTECLRLTLSTDTGDGAPLAGTWWAIGGQGVVAFEVAGDTGQWQLSGARAVESEALGECDGTW